MPIDKMIPRFLVSDEDERLLKEGAMTDALNVTISEDGDGSEGVVKNVKGTSNAVVDLGLAGDFSGQLKVIGQVSDSQLGFIYFFVDQDIAVLVTNVVLGIIYLVLGSWTSKKPLVAILLGLLLYLTTIIISAIFEPSTIIKGIIFKIIIIAYLAKGVYSASSIKK